MSELGYRRDIDGLRAVAVLLVLIFHFELLPWGSAGFIGVDVFFVISGFLITSIVWRQLERGSFGFMSFYAARVRRLAPALVVTLAATMAFGFWRLTPLELVELGRQVAATQFYLSNVYYWQNVNYFGLRADQVALLHTWSLAVEEQFYLLFPATLVLLHRRARRWFWLAIAALAIVSFLLNLWFVGSKPMATFYLLPPRAWELLLGALLAAPALKRSSSRVVNEALGLAGVAAIVVATSQYEEGTGIPGWFALYPVLGTVALLLAGADNRTWLSRLLATEPMVWVGKISYVAYLVHWPIHVFAYRQWGADYGLGLRVAMFVMSLAIAWAVWRWIESPVRERRWLASTQSMVLGYATALTATAALTTMTVFTGGLPQRLPAEAARLASFATDRTAPLKECEYSGPGPWKPVTLCRIGVPNAEPRWLVFGDSHAWAGHDGFDQWLRTRGEAAWFAYRNSCPPLRGVHLVMDRTEKCLNFNDGVYAWLASQRQVDSVLMVSTWYQAAEGGLSDVPTLHRDKPRSLAVFNARFGASLSELHAAGKRIYLWAPVPGARESVPLALAMAAWQGGAPDLEITRDEHDRQFDFFYDELSRHRALVDVLIVPADELCQTGRCRVQDGRRLLYFDNAHVTASTGDVWARLILRAEQSAGAVR